MKKTLPILIVSLLLTASWAMGAASLAFDDSTNSGTLTDTNAAPNMGTFASGTGTFTFDVNYTFSGGTSTGLSYWLETEAGTASSISITNETYFTFTTAQNSSAKPWLFNDTSGRTSASFLTDQGSSGGETGDLGATGTAQNAGTYKVSTLQFTLSGLAPGTYHIETTTANPKVSEGTVAFADNPFSQTVYTFTVSPVPEPATWSMLGLGGLGSFGLTWLRARKRS
jgi:hypothetical protein